MRRFIVPGAIALIAVAVPVFAWIMTDDVRNAPAPDGAGRLVNFAQKAGSGAGWVVVIGSIVIGLMIAALVVEHAVKKYRRDRARV